MYCDCKIRVSTLGLKLEFSPPQLNALPLSYDAPHYNASPIDNVNNINLFLAKSSHNSRGRGKVRPHLDICVGNMVKFTTTI